MRDLGFWRWHLQHKVRRFRWWISDPETLKELSDCCVALVAAWIAVGILVLALWASGQ